MTPRYPEVEVQLTEEDGNAFHVLGKVREALRKAGHEVAAREFVSKAINGDYDHLLRTAMEYVEVK